MWRAGYGFACANTIPEGARVRLRDGATYPQEKITGVVCLRLARVRYQADQRLQVGSAIVSTSSRQLFGHTVNLTLTKQGEKDGLHFDIDGKAHLEYPEIGKEVQLPAWLKASLRIALMEVVPKPEGIE